jgi:dynein heavy chain
VLTTGVDPTPDLQKLAEERGVSMIPLSMGRGQGEKLESMLKEASQVGRWIYLANCHLSIFLLPEIEKIMDDLFKS